VEMKEKRQSRRCFTCNSCCCWRSIVAGGGVAL
jgi:hypothetical protein